MTTYMKTIAATDITHRLFQIRLLRACQDTLCVSHSEDFAIRTFVFKEVQEDFPPTPEQDPIGAPGHATITTMKFTALDDYR
jgi:hypothetical protein